eukprot:TRINITY_DN9401_c0_g1_i1.p2 TRINITY_DN9401_c0_g1~~TRINITY_DN9401_c0_g1_i1.p2  ORF type:complete len:83 (-),score=24.28 TRINITY_DN9401_c0_g1_i1:50-298(-)
MTAEHSDQHQQQPHSSNIQQTDVIWTKKGVTALRYNTRTKFFQCPTEGCLYQHENDMSVVIHLTRHCASRVKEEEQAEEATH